MLTVKNLRHSFTEFFDERGHKIVPSSSLVPKDDPTLLFTTAGMVQFKPMFAGTVDLEYTRAASIQKCLRTSDLENVGKTKRHCTLFEMLGNFSFGDYFKREAIEYAWDFSTNVIGFPKDKIWVTIYLDDDEAFQLWNKHIGIPAERIVRLGKKDNFWGPAGDSGACGPCSELYLDRGEAYGCGSPDCKPGCDCERYMEFWNLVFNQFYQDVNGVQSPLPRTGIDTGMGLERLATLVQGVDSIYQTNELKELVDFVCKSANVKYEGSNMVAAHVIVEHARSLTFAMSDGAYPSNEGRGYVLRRILRRSLRFSRQLGITEPFVYRVVDPVVAMMGSHYPEIVGSAENVKNVIRGEEERFLETLENGMDRLDELAKKAAKGTKIISGREAFVLYDTFGFPLEMTTEMAEEQGLNVDLAGFNTEMDEQRQRGKNSWKGADVSLDNLFKNFEKLAGATQFEGYNKNECQTTVAALGLGTESVEMLNTGDTGYIVTKATTLYGESGGQQGDTGRLSTDSGALFLVKETRKINKTYVHCGEVVNGPFKLGDNVKTEYDVIERNLTRANHTVTHILQAALRDVLGSHVKQAGSLVTPERMRFDFSHFKPMTREELDKVESIVNQKIWEGLTVETKTMDLDEAVKTGAMAVFDEKYEDVVRVVSVGNFSRELCGGTHVTSSSQIGAFKIIKESSPGAGLRRIEGLTMRGVWEKLTSNQEIISALCDEFNAQENELTKKINDIAVKASTLEKELGRLKNSQLTANIDTLISTSAEIKGIKLVVQKIDGVGIEELRSLADTVRGKVASSVILLGTVDNEKGTLMFAATKPAVDKGIDCGLLIKEAVKFIGGNGGGRKDMAQAGGKNPAGLADALKIAQNMIEEKLK